MFNIKLTTSEYDFRIYGSGAVDVIKNDDNKYCCYKLFDIKYYTQFQVDDLISFLTVFPVTHNNKILVTYRDDIEGTYPINNFSKFDAVIDLDNNVSGALCAVGSTPVLSIDNKKYIKTKEGLLNVKTVGKLFVDDYGRKWSNFGKVIDTIYVENSSVIYITEDLFVVHQYGEPIVIDRFMIKENVIYTIEDESLRISNIDELIDLRKVLIDEKDQIENR